jgi:hypothetical protein
MAAARTGSSCPFTVPRAPLIATLRTEQSSSTVARRYWSAREPPSGWPKSISAG